MTHVSKERLSMCVWRHKKQIDERRRPGGHRVGMSCAVCLANCRTSRGGRGIHLLICRAGSLPSVVHQVSPGSVLVTRKYDVS